MRADNLRKSCLLVKTEIWWTESSSGNLRTCRCQSNQSKRTRASAGTVQFGISTEPNLIGTYTVATDASGRKSRAITGIYGLMRVDEATDKRRHGWPRFRNFSQSNLKLLITATTSKARWLKSRKVHRIVTLCMILLGRLILVRQPEQTPNPDIATNPGNLK